MIKNKKILPLLIILAFFMSCFASCGKINPEEDVDKVGIILPSNTDLAWVQSVDAFNAFFEGKNIEHEILFSQNSVSAEMSSVEALIERETDVLILCSVDPKESVNAVKKAKKAKMKVICYETLIPGTDDVDYFATFSSYDAGVKQGKYLIEKFKDKKNIPLYLYAGDASDDEMVKIFAGAWSVLGDAVSKGQFTVQNCEVASSSSGKELTLDEDKKAIVKMMNTVSTKGSEDTAKGLALANLESVPKDGKGSVAVLAPNDEAARTLSAIFEADKGIKNFVITGNGAEEASLKLIKEGKQSMTIWQDSAGLAKATAEAASQLFTENPPKTNATYNNGKIDVPAIESEVVVVDKKNISKLEKSGAFSKEQLEEIKKAEVAKEEKKEKEAASEEKKEDSKTNQ